MLRIVPTVKSTLFGTVGVIFVAAIVASAQNQGAGAPPGHGLNGKRLSRRRASAATAVRVKPVTPTTRAPYHRETRRNGSSKIRTIRSSCMMAATMARGMA